MATEGTDPQIVQSVSAINGFAYGVIGADIHVFASGLPLYLLANWRPEPAASENWLRELPSRMLNARRAVVPFTGRDNDLMQLRQWRDSGARLAVRWLHGPGGQGKTRLANQLASESALAGWKVVAAFHGPDADRPEVGSQDMRLDGATGILMVVDYADRWLLTNMTWLLKNALLHQTGVVTRILMVARTADSWPAVRGIMDTYQADASSQYLPALAQESGERATMFMAAVDSFRLIYQVAEPVQIGLPEPLDSPEFGLVLAVHMAALVAVDACATGKRLPDDMIGLTSYLLDREQLQWTRLYTGNAASEATARRTYRTPPEVMNRAVFTATLTGSIPHAVGVAVLEDLQLPNPESVLEDHAVCYPPAGLSHADVLEPLYPDRLAEDFLALTIPGHHADYPAQPWATPVITELLARHSDQNVRPSWTSRAITMLASAAQRWSHLGTGYLSPILLGDPELAVDAGGAALAAIACLPDITTAVLEAIEGHLPHHQHVDLDSGIAALTQRLADYRLTTTSDPVKIARINDDLSMRLRNAGLDREALRAAEQAAQIYRELAAASPASFEPGLARSLDNLGTLLGETGRLEEALSATEEAVQIGRRLARSNPVAYEEHLAGSLSNLGAWLGGVGRHREALTATEEAVQLYGRLSEVNPAEFDPSLAAALANLGFRMRELGLHAEAAVSTERAVQIYRRLADANPAAFEPSLATSLSNFGGCLAALGRIQDALGAVEQAVQVYRRLAKINPAAFEPNLALSLSNLSAGLGELDRQEEALAAAEQAVKVYRRLAESNQVRFEPPLATSLSNLGVMLGELRRREEAVAATKESVQIYTRLAEVNPAAFEADLAVSVDNLGARLAEVGRRGEALAFVQQGLRLHQRLAASSPARFLIHLAVSLTRLTDLAEDDDGIVHATSAWLEAIAGLDESTSRSELRAHFARALAAHDDYDAAVAQLEAATADTTTGEPPHVAHARQLIRSVTTEIGAQRSVLPAWATEPIPNPDIELAQIWTQQSDWKDAEAFLLRHAARLMEVNFRKSLILLTALHPDNGTLANLMGIIADFDSNGVDATLNRITVASEFLPVFNAWISTPTWDDSKRFFAEHKSELTTEIARELISGNDTEIFRQHLAIIELTDNLPPESVYDIVADPSRAHEHALECVQTANIRRLRLILAAAPKIATLPVFVLAAGEISQARRLAQHIADHATPDVRERHAMLLRVYARLWLEPVIAATANELADLIQNTGPS